MRGMAREMANGALRLVPAEDVPGATWLSRVKGLCAEGDRCTANGDLAGALAAFRRALDLLPEPYTKWAVAVDVLSAIGDTFFAMGRFADGAAVFSAAAQCTGGMDNAFIHLRWGQCAFENGDIEKAKVELLRAYRGGGDGVFAGAEKYLAWVRGVG